MRLNKIFLLSFAIGVITTIFASFLPTLIDPFIASTFPRKLRPLNKNDGVVKYLTSIKNDPHVLISLHGYTHTCPVCGSTDHEFFCPEGSITDAEIREHVDAGLKAFEESGLTKLGIDPLAFDPPGITWDERLWEALEERGFSILRNTIATRLPGQPLKTRLTITAINFATAISFANYTDPKLEKIKNIILGENVTLGEYTWGWRNITDTTNDPRYAQAIELVEKDKPTILLLHAMDYNEVTEQFLDHVLSQESVKLVRMDDITIHENETRALVNLVRKHDRLVILAVIPTTFAPPHSPLRILIDISWYAFLGTFVLPTTTFMVWGLMGRMDRKKNTMTTLLTLATCTSIYLFTRLGPSAICVIFSVASGCLIGWKLGKKGAERNKNDPPVKFNPHNPLVSIVLPAYNEEKTIVSAIENVLKQDYSPKEIIVVDDGSTDATRKIAESYAEAHENVIVYSHKQNKGKPTALNLGTKLAKGSIILHSDSDSYLVHDVVSKVVPHFKDKEVGGVACMVAIDNDSKLLCRLQQLEYLFEQLTLRFCQSLTKNVIICPGACSAFHSQFAKTTKVSDRTLTEDADYTFEAHKKGWKIAQEPDAVSFTKAPENIKALINQRKRWLYGVIQTLWVHKYTFTKAWVLWAWLGYILSPLSTVLLASIPLLIWVFGSTYIWFFFPYFIPAFCLFTFSRWLPLVFYRFGGKQKLVLLSPLYWFYNVFLGLLTLYCFIMWVIRRGVRVRYGGRDILAI